MNIVSGAVLALITTVGASAQSGPPLDVVMALDPQSGANQITSILVDRAGERRAYTPDEWIRPIVEGYRQAKAAIIVAYGEPADPALGIPRGGVLREGLPADPIPGDKRAGLVTDDLANSMLLNIADDAAGLTLGFRDGLVNGPGADLVILEGSIPVGAVSNACPGVPAPGADAMVIGLANGQSVTLDPAAFLDFGPAGAQLNHGAPALGRADVRIQNLDELRTGDFVPLAGIDYFKVYAIAFDLSDLGVPADDAIDGLTLSSTGEMVATDAGPRLCWTADPILVVGLPA